MPTPPLTAAETCSVAITKDSNPRSLPSCPRIPPLLPSLASERGSKMCILGRPTFCPPVSRRPTPYGRKDLLLRPLHGIMAHGLQLGTLLFSRVRGAGEVHCRLRPCQREAWAGCTCTGRNTLAFTNSILPPAQVVSTVLRLCLPMHLHTTDLAQYPLALAFRPRRERERERKVLTLLPCGARVSRWHLFIRLGAHSEPNARENNVPHYIGLLSLSQGSHDYKQKK